MNKLLVILILVSMSVSTLMAQGGVNSPFSRYGIGDLNSEAPLHLRQMGGISTGYVDVQRLNFDNPASLGYLQSTAFDIGLNYKRTGISDAESKSNQSSGNLNYLQFGFPLRNPVNAIFEKEDYKFNWGMGFALLPNSDVSYSIAQRDSIGGASFDRLYEGKGGTYKFVIGNAIKYGNLSVGAGLGWMFGNIDYLRFINFDNVDAYDNQFSNTYSLRGFYSKIGATYLHVLNKESVTASNGRVTPNTLSLGLTYKPSIGATTKSEQFNFNFNANGFRDTISYVPVLEGSASLPSELGMGAVLTIGYKFGFGVDLKRTFWENYFNDAGLIGEREAGSFTNTTRIGFGGYYRPNYASINSPFARASYKLGFYIDEDPRAINNERIKTWALTGGIGLPLAWQRKFSQMDLGFELGKRSVQNTLQENFFQLTFGFTFNESDWFRKFYLD